MQVQLILTATTPKEAAQLYSVTSLISSAIAGEAIEEMTPARLKAPEETESAKELKSDRKERKPRKTEKQKALDLDDAGDDDLDLLGGSKASSALSLDDDDVTETEEKDDSSDDDIFADTKSKSGEKVKTSKLTLEGDVLPAFVAYAKKYDRKKAAAILEKYGVKSVRELPTDSFEKVMKKLNA